MLERIRNITEIGKNLGLITLCSIAIFYIIITVWGNIALDNQADPEKGYPSVRSAPYQLTISTTGQLLFTKNVETVRKEEPQIYRLVTYYTQDGGKYRLVKVPLTLDERIWGDVEIKHR